MKSSLVIAVLIYSRLIRPFKLASLHADLNGQVTTMQDEMLKRVRADAVLRIGRIFIL